jgi:hypothetical protein
MLNSSSQICIPNESDFVLRLFGRNAHEELSEKRIAQLLDVILETIVSSMSGWEIRRLPKNCW